jgi:hypothetical protein
MMNAICASVGLLIAFSPAATGQVIGIELCSCAPTTYEFTLDFSLSCPPVNITLGDAVQATSCLVSPFGNPEIDELIPIAVKSIDILEMGQDLRVLVQENYGGYYSNGYTFTYASVTADPANINTPVDIPRALQLNIVGVNSKDEPIINVYIITFTNDCESYPVLSTGQSAGWTRFVSSESGCITHIPCRHPVAHFMNPFASTELSRATRSHVLSTGPDSLSDSYSFIPLLPLPNNVTDIITNDSSNCNPIQRCFAVS